MNSIVDTRQEWKVIHKLSDMVSMVLMGLLANADDWHEMEIFAKSNKDILRKYIELKNGIPSHDTIQRVMACIKAATLQTIVSLWHKLLNDGETEKLKKIFCIDGKTMRGSGNKNQNPLHIVSAWSKEDGVCFGQKSSDCKGKEIPMIQELLDVITVKDQVVTIDAIGAQTEIAAKIKKGKGDYVLSLKGNQPSLHEDVSVYFSDAEFTDEVKAQGLYLKTTEQARGQIEVREYFQTSDIGWLKSKKEWHGLKTIGMVKTTCKSDKGER